MAVSSYNNQSTSQDTPANSSNNTNTSEYVVPGQWANHQEKSQYTDVYRPWSTTDNSNTQSQAQGSFTSSSAANTDSMTPMERWAAESSQQAAWNSVGSVGTSSNNSGAGNSNGYVQYQQQAGDNWSTCGNP